MQMKNQRRSRRHARMKAPAGAYSDRNGPRALQLEKPADASGEGDPWLKARPVVGMTAAIIPVVGAMPLRA